MKQLLAISMIFVLFIPICGVFSWFCIQKQQVRREVKQKIIGGIDRSQLTYFKMSLSDAAKLNWEHSKEFEFNGEMYDVVERQTIKDTVEFWCWRDNEETELNRKLATLTAKAQGNNQEHQNSKKQLHSFVRGLFFEPIENINFAVFFSLVKAHTVYSGMFKTLTTSPAVPPPQLS